MTADVSIPLQPGEWVDEHGDYLFRYALARVRDVDAAEDLVQETFVAAIKAKDRFAGTSSLRTWLVGILKHKVLDHFRNQSRTSPVSDIVSSGAGDEAEDAFFDRNGHWVIPPKAWDSPDDALERKQFQETLTSCLAKLPASMSQLFVLRDMEEVESEQVCSMLGISSSNLYTMLHRARFQLRRCLEIHWFGKGEQS